MCVFSSLRKTVVRQLFGQLLTVVEVRLNSGVDDGVDISCLDSPSLCMHKSPRDPAVTASFTVIFSAGRKSRIHRKLLTEAVNFGVFPDSSRVLNSCVEIHKLVM